MRLSPVLPSALSSTWTVALGKSMERGGSSEAHPAELGVKVRVPCAKQEFVKLNPRRWSISACAHVAASASMPELLPSFMAERKRLVSEIMTIPSRLIPTKISAKAMPFSCPPGLTRRLKGSPRLHGAGEGRHGDRARGPEHRVRD